MGKLDIPHIRRLIYLVDEKIKKTQWVLENKAKDEEKSRLEQQIDFDEELMKMLEEVLEEMS